MIGVEFRWSLKHLGQLDDYLFDVMWICLTHLDEHLFPLSDDPILDVDVEVLRDLGCFVLLRVVPSYHG